MPMDMNTSIFGFSGNGSNNTNPKKLKTAWGRPRMVKYWQTYRTITNHPYCSHEFRNDCGWEVLSRWDPEFDP